MIYQRASLKVALVSFCSIAALGAIAIHWQGT
jgi:membrane protein implicated in regulation of membrane protease activity